MPIHVNGQKLRNQQTKDGLAGESLVPTPNDAMISAAPYPRAIRLVAMQGAWTVNDTDDGVYRVVAGTYIPIGCVRAILNNGAAAGIVYVDLDETTSLPLRLAIGQEERCLVTRVYLEQATTATDIILWK